MWVELHIKYLGEEWRGPWDEGREKKNAERKEKEGREVGRGTEMR